MASFPTSVFNPTARSNGQTIDASHINDLQNEVNAIEDGYINGTAPLNSSNSTLANLSVAGASTLGTLQGGASTVTSLSVSGGSTLGTVTAGNSTVAALSVSGGSTLGTVQAGDSTFSGITVTGGARLNVPTAVVTRTSTLALGSTAYVGINWDTILVDNFSMVSTSVNSSRITFVQSSGWYLVTVNLTGSFHGTAGYKLRIYADDSSQCAAASYGAADNVVPIPMSVSGLVHAADTTAYVTAQVAQISGGSTSSLLAESTDASARMSAHLVSI